jgi:ribose 5-phosphate isomerase B
MVIYIGADHRGFKLKEFLSSLLKYGGYPVVDVGNEKYDEADNYVDFGKRVAERVSVDYDHNRGILICGSGVGMDIVANKHPNVRAALALTSDQAFDSRNDDDTNVLCLGANYLNEEQAKKIVLTWIQTPFSQEPRHRKRIESIAQVEMERMRPLHGEDPA